MWQQETYSNTQSCALLKSTENEQQSKSKLDEPSIEENSAVPNSTPDTYKINDQTVGSAGHKKVRNPFQILMVQPSKKQRKKSPTKIFSGTVKESEKENAAGCGARNPLNDSSVNKGNFSTNTVSDESASSTIKKSPGVSYVHFCLETGGKTYLNPKNDIQQIYALFGDKQFSRYIAPTKPIAENSSRMNGFFNVEGQLCYRKKCMETVSCSEALAEFIDFLWSFQDPVLVGHKCRKFYLPFLYVHLKEHGLWDQFASTVTGFVDTLTFFKKECPSVLFFGDQYPADEHVRTLWNISQSYFDKFPNYQCKISSIACIVNAKRCRLTLNPIIGEKCLTEGMAKKISKAGLSYNDLIAEFKRAGSEGLLALMSNASVTTHPGPIQKIYDYFKKSESKNLLSLR